MTTDEHDAPNTDITIPEGGGTAADPILVPAAGLAGAVDGGDAPSVTIPETQPEVQVVYQADVAAAEAGPEKPSSDE